MLNLHVNIAADFFLHPPYPTRIIFFVCFGMVHAMDNILIWKCLSMCVSPWSSEMVNSDLLWTILNDQIDPQCLSVSYTIVSTSLLTIT